MRNYYMVSYDNYGNITSYRVCNSQEKPLEGYTIIEASNFDLKTCWIKDKKLKYREAPPGMFYHWNGQWNYSKAAALSYVRNERDKKLLESDWRALPDAPGSEAWLDYRQALRDMTENLGEPDNPEDIVWPEEPAE